ncbi:hypothetical protein Bca52824_023109 [Brassica carinata]|uniref:Uncharacterized protein n=1 Tax=Brassica carinata TaxID=52824 RepID=A0A8X7VHY8_BRACI|nr:hypothetical protein Bca52824_023109 [Brassica carinata]
MQVQNPESPKTYADRFAWSSLRSLKKEPIRMIWSPQDSRPPPRVDEVTKNFDGYQPAINNRVFVNRTRWSPSISNTEIRKGWATQKIPSTVPGLRKMQNPAAKGGTLQQGHSSQREAKTPWVTQQ